MEDCFDRWVQHLFHWFQVFSSDVVVKRSNRNHLKGEEFLYGKQFLFRFYPEENLFNVGVYNIHPVKTVHHRWTLHYLLLSLHDVLWEVRLILFHFTLNQCKQSSVKLSTKCYWLFYWFKSLKVQLLKCLIKYTMMKLSLSAGHVAECVVWVSVVVIVRCYTYLKQLTLGNSSTESCLLLLHSELDHVSSIVEWFCSSYFENVSSVFHFK